MSDENDHPISLPETFELQGQKYRLVLRGAKWVGHRWVGSEYCQSFPEHFWYAGTGKVVDTSPGQEKVFIFETWEDERNRNRGLINYVLISDFWKFGLQKELRLVEKAKPRLIDALCELVLLRISRSKEIIPEIVFGQLTHSWLVNNGFVAEDSGQIRLGWGTN